jgi:hypothetical protein
VNFLLDLLGPGAARCRIPRICQELNYLPLMVPKLFFYETGGVLPLLVIY